MVVRVWVGDDNRDQVARGWVDRVAVTFGHRDVRSEFCQCDHSVLPRAWSTVEQQDAATPQRAKPIRHFPPTACSVVSDAFDFTHALFNMPLGHTMPPNTISVEHRRTLAAAPQRSYGQPAERAREASGRCSRVVLFKLCSVRIWAHTTLAAVVKQLDGRVSNERLALRRLCPANRPTLRETRSSHAT